MAGLALVNPAAFSIDEFDDFYRLNNVVYNGRRHAVDWSKDILDNGKKHTQDGWVNLTKGEEWTLADAPLYYATFKALHGGGEYVQSGIQKSVSAMFVDDLLSGWVMTSTHIKLKEGRVLGELKQDDDHILHRYGYDDEEKMYFSRVCMGGSLSRKRIDERSEGVMGMTAADIRTVNRGLLEAEGSTHSTIDTILGSDGLNEVRTVTKWLSGEEPHLWFHSEGGDRFVCLYIDRSGLFKGGDFHFETKLLKDNGIPPGIRSCIALVARGLFNEGKFGINTNGWSGSKCIARGVRYAPA